MQSPQSDAPTNRRIYLLADHLDAILAAGEDMRKLAFRRPAIRPDETAPGCSLNGFVSETRQLEFAAIARIMQARENAAEVAKLDDRFAPLARLFVSGTATVIDTIDDIADKERHAFAHGFDPLVYLRNRGLIASHAGCLSIVEELVIGDDFLLAGRIELGVLLDMCATFLDVLDEHFDLFPPIPPKPDKPRSAIARAQAQ